VKFQISGLGCFTKGWSSNLYTVVEKAVFMYHEIAQMAQRFEGAGEGILGRFLVVWLIVLQESDASILGSLSYELQCFLDNK
jgi:hypothetical protein